MKDLDKAKQLIADAKHIVIASPDNPDIDSVSSNLALAVTFKAMGKKVDLVAAEDLPESLSWMLQDETYLTLEQLPNVKKANPSLVVVTDFGSLVQLKLLLADNNWLIKDQPTLIFDHHAFRDDFAATANVIEPKAAATGELLYDVYMALGWEITPRLANLMMAGLIADTGSFQHTNTGARQFEVASKLARLGAKTYPLNQSMTKAHAFSPDQFQTLAKLLRNVHFDGAVVYGLIPYEAIKAYGPNAGFKDKLGEQIRYLKGVKASFVLAENPDGSLRLSMRSQPEVDVSKVGRQFNGGGHKVAAGGTITGLSLEEAAKAVLAKIKEQL